MTETTQEISSIAQQVQTLVAERPPRITTDAELTAATGWLAQVRKRRKEIEEFFDRLIKPFRQAIAEHKRQCDNLLAPLRTEESAQNGEILRYRQEQARQAAEAQRRAEAQYDRRVERAMEKGKDPALVKPPPVVAAPAKTVETDGAKVTFRKIRKFRVRNPDEVPREYWVIDEVKIGKAVRAGIQVPGCDVWEEETSAVS